ncbi:MAG: hypothetical protein RIB03_05190 [Henriciella sp.]|uniref:hypothetical protein n=1 Tax=Henriciella sp. TaxID=1968823 RepID=UPI0032F0147B
MRRYFLFASASALIALSASADPLLEKARAATEAEGPLYAYEMEYFDGEVRATGKIDPSQPEGQRITVYTPDESERDEDFRKAIESLDADVTGDIFCDDFASQIPDSARRTEETGDEVHYAFTPEADADADDMERKIMKKIDASAVVSKSDGQILAFRMSLPKPFKPALVAKINTFQLDASCARAPDGRTYLEDMQLDISGSAMMQAFDQTTSRRITKLLEPVTTP